MTNEEAIIVLKNHRIRFADDHGWDKTTLDAFDIAIKGLSTKPEIIRCKDCVFYDVRGCNVFDWKSDENGFCYLAKKRKHKYDTTLYRCEKCGYYGYDEARCRRCKFDGFEEKRKEGRLPHD